MVQRKVQSQLHLSSNVSMQHHFNKFGSLRCHKDENENVKKAVSWIGKTKTLHVLHTFFWTFHCHHCTTMTWKYLTCTFTSHFTGTWTSNIEIIFLFLNLEIIHRNLTPRDFSCTRESKPVRITPMTIERAWIQILSNIFVAITILVF